MSSYLTLRELIIIIQEFACFHFFTFFFFSLKSVIDEVGVTPRVRAKPQGELPLGVM
jgi:hypothetical protein